MPTRGNPALWAASAVLAVAAGAAHLFAENAGSERWALLAKPIPVLLLLAWVAVAGRSPLKGPLALGLALSAVADVKFEDGPPMISSDNAILRGAVMFNVRDRDLGSTVKEAMEQLNKRDGILPEGYFLELS